MLLSTTILQPLLTSPQSQDHPRLLFVNTEGSRFFNSTLFMSTMVATEDMILVLNQGDLKA